MHFLSTYTVPGTITGAEAIAMNKTNTNDYLPDAYILVGRN